MKTQNRQRVAIRWPTWIPEFLAHLAMHRGNATVARQCVDVPRSTLYHTRNRDRYFRTLWESIAYAFEEREAEHRERRRK